MRTEILGVPFDVVTNDEALKKLLFYLAEDKNHLMFTPNPEMVMAAQKDDYFMQILKAGDLVVPDGIGIVLASKFNKVRIKERVAGCDTVTALLKKAKSGTTVYLLGSKPGVCDKAKQNIERDYPNISVIGSHNGYFNKEEEILILEEIKQLKPDILLVGLGFPKQEKWLYENRGLPVRISAGIGGSLDVFAGTVKRAPVLFQRFGLEWLYRLIKQPSRIGRILVLPVFALKVAAGRLTGRQ